MFRCLAPDSQLGGLGCDNMTVVLVCLLHNQPWAQLVSRCGTLQQAKEAAARQEMEEELRLAEEAENVPDGPLAGLSNGEKEPPGPEDPGE